MSIELTPKKAALKIIRMAARGERFVSLETAHKVAEAYKRQLAKMRKMRPCGPFEEAPPKGQDLASLLATVESCENPGSQENASDFVKQVCTPELFKWLIRKAWEAEDRKEHMMFCSGSCVSFEKRHKENASDEQDDSPRMAQES